VISTNGDTFLGGDDFDLRIIEWAVDEYRKDQGIDLRQDKMALQRLKEAAEKAKIELSTTLQTDLNLPFITADASGPKHLALTLSRARLEQLTADLVERTVGPCKAALRDAGLEPSQIDEVVLVGGQTRMPCVAEQVKAVFNREPHKGVNPDEVVAVGAAIQAGVLAGDVKDILLLDVCPLTLGLETLGGVMTPLIPRNTTIPTAKGETFTTAADGQTSVEVHVLQGERPMAAENKSLARFILDGLLPAPRGLPQIEVAFDIDVNGILNVSAKDKSTGKEQKIVIQASSGLAKNEIDRMVREAELHAEDDRRLREEIEERNRADSLAYQAEKIVRESGDKLPSDLKTEVEEKTKTLQDALRANDITAMREAQTALQEALNRAGQAVYTAQAQRTEGDVGTNGQAPESGKHGSGSPSGSVEGEYREV
jgi:molecular chaperone DnaK